VADEQHSSALLTHIFHFTQAFLLEPHISHRKYFVHNKYLGLEVRGYGECEPNVHAAGIALDRGVEEPLYFSEGDDLIELLSDLVLAHAEDDTIQKDILASGELWVEPGADFEKAGHSPADGDHASGWFGDAAEYFQQRGFARAVAPNDADAVALMDVEAHIPQRPEFFVRRVVFRHGEWMHQFIRDAFCASRDHIAQGRVAFLPLVAEDVALGQVLDVDGSCHGQITSAKAFSVLRKNITPVMKIMATSPSDSKNPGQYI